MKESRTEINCLSDIRGQETAKRAMEVAASGKHSLLLVGPGGQGKSALVSLQPNIMGVDLVRHEIRWNTIRENDAALLAAADLHDVVVTMPALSASDWFLPAPAETTEVVAARVAKVHDHYHPDLELHAEATKLFVTAYEKMRMSPRTADKVTRLARTLAIMDDLEAKFVARVNLAEALCYVYQPPVDTGGAVG